MTTPVIVARGTRVLRRLLDRQTHDLRTLDAADFRFWLDMHLAHWRADPVFAQRTVIRDLRQLHPEIRRLETEREHATAVDAATPTGQRLRVIDRELSNTVKAIDGLTAVLAAATHDRATGLRQKREVFATRRVTLTQERDELIQTSPERQALIRRDDELQRLQVETGLERETACLGELLLDRGRHTGRGGERFEVLAATVTRSHILPGLLLRLRAGSADRVCVLTGVTLGAARLEFDQLVVRQPCVPGRPVEVLAAVEAKRDINDVAHGFRRRQENLAWLVGDRTGYDPSAARTRAFPTGHFDRPAVHREGGEAFVFAPPSFRRFLRNAGAVFDRLYFVTRPGPLWGVSSAALARITARVATDERWDPDDEGYLAELLRWSRSLAGPVETPDVLRMYAPNPQQARRILFVGP